jgi:hypothetical protein
MNKELIEFEVGTLEWALAKAVNGCKVTHPLLNDVHDEERGRVLAVSWNGSTEFSVDSYGQLDKKYTEFMDCLSVFIDCVFGVRSEYKIGWSVFSEK